MKICIIGSGNIGGTLGQLWVAAGHQVLFGARNPPALNALVNRLGDNASAHSIRDAVVAGEVTVFAGPYGAWPEFANAEGNRLRGKIVIDAANPYGERDGTIVDSVARMGQGSGSFTASLLPGARVVKAFNTIYWLDLRDKAHRTGELLAMPIAGDDPLAVETAANLARDAGFDPVVVGGLARSTALDATSPIYAKSMTAAGVRRALNLQ